MDREDFEFLLTQYLDGVLAPPERAAVEERLASDPAARKLLEEYQNLDRIMAGAADDLPPLRWDRVAENISQAVADEADRPIFFLGRAPVRAALAMAASLLLVVSVVRFVTRQAGSPVAPQGPMVVAVAGPRAEVAAGPSSIDVSVSQPAEADAASAYSDSDALVVRRPMVALDGFTNQGPSDIR